MRLAELLAAARHARASGATDVEIAGMTHDSRSVKPGWLFFALQGAKDDGNRHAQEAFAKGAAAVVSELKAPPPPLTPKGAWIETAAMPETMAEMASVFFGHPSRGLTTIGVTGTKGKTTVTYLLESIIDACGGACGVIGTVNYRLKGRQEPAPNTTPIAVELNRVLARFKSEGATHAALEISSHALALKRAHGLAFDAAIFTNLGRDHLDFHKTQEEYAKAKEGLFEMLSRVDNPKKRRVAVLNADDPEHARYRRAAGDAETLTYGLGAGASYRAENVKVDLEKTRFTLAGPKKRLDAELRLIGSHNVLNASAAATACLALGLPETGVLAGLKSLASVPGRLEPVEAGQPYRVFVDYAHTAESLETVLVLLRGLAKGRLITVFGCGGDRDAGKRPAMGKAAGALSDLVIATSDNPRSEDPLAILREIEAGLKLSGRENYKIVPDRREAVGEAVRAAKAGDVVLIAGKGHETTQTIGDRVLPFDDRQVAREAIR